MQRRVNGCWCCAGALTEGRVGRGQAEGAGEGGEEGAREEAEQGVEAAGKERLDERDSGEKGQQPGVGEVDWGDEGKATEWLALRLWREAVDATLALWLRQLRADRGVDGSSSSDERRLRVRRLCTAMLACCPCL